MAQPSALASIIRCWINGVEVVEATDIDIQKPRPLGQKFGAAGLIGTYKGQAGGRVQLTFAQPSQKAQFEQFALAAEDPENGFTFVFTKGGTRWLMSFCFAGDAGMRGNYESGDTSVTLSIIGTQPKQVA